MKKLFVGLCSFFTLLQPAWACTPGIAGTGPAGDPNCMAPILNNDPYYNSGNRGINRPRAKPEVIYIKKPDSWGAIVITKKEGNKKDYIHIEVDKNTKKAATKEALQHCHDMTGRTCESLLSWANGCASVVKGTDAEKKFRLYAYSQETAEAADKYVLGLCRKDKRSNCEIIVSNQCSLPK